MLRRRVPGHHRAGWSARRRPTIPTGYLVDRIGRRRILLIGPIIAALASFLTASRTILPPAPGVQVPGRLGSADVDDQPTDRGGRHHDHGVRAAVRSPAWWAWSHAGALMGPALGGFSAAIAGIRAPFLIHGVLAAIAIIPSFGLIRETNPMQAAANRDTPGQSAPRSSYSYAALLTGPVLLLFVAQLLANLIRGASGQGGGGPLFLYAAYAYDAGPALLGTLGTIGAVLGLPPHLSRRQPHGQVRAKGGRGPRNPAPGGRLVLPGGLRILQMAHRELHGGLPLDKHHREPDVRLPCRRWGPTWRLPRPGASSSASSASSARPGCSSAPSALPSLLSWSTTPSRSPSWDSSASRPVLWISIMIKDTRIPA